MRFLPGLLIALLPLTAQAQLQPRSPDGVGIAPVACTGAATQIELNACAERDWQAADRELNAVWKDAMGVARALGATNGVAASDMLRDAQWAWIPFRDAACAAEAQLAAGGSMMGFLTYDCLARLTRARTFDLRLFLNAR